MKIGYLFRTFPQLSQTFVTNEICELERLGHTIVIGALYRPGEGITYSLGSMASRALYWFDIDKSLWARILKANARIFWRYPKSYIKLFGTDINHPIQFLKKVFLAHYYHFAKVDHIHTHFAWEQVDLLCFIKELTGIPFSITLHAADIYSEVYPMEKSGNNAAFLVTISQYNRQYLIEQMLMDPKIIHVVHCGVSPVARLPYKPREDQSLLILSVGRMTDKKGFDLLIRAVGQLHAKGLKVTAKIIGDGPLRPKLEKLISQLSLDRQIELPGSLDHGAVMEAVQDCDLFVLPCRQAENGDIDGIPVVLMEAMAAGKPVVSTALSGIPELVQPGAGILVEPENSDQLSIAMETILGDGKKAFAMGQKGRLIVQNEFSIQGQAERIAHLIRASGPRGDKR
jgi:glycosyltransferase involved in cell wall biosynthesis